MSSSKNKRSLPAADQHQKTHRGPAPADQPSHSRGNVPADQNSPRRDATPVDPHQKAGWITIIGRPNVGKSTLMNLVLQTPISLVTPKAQTTRDRLLGIYTEKEGQIIFTDTPGIHKAKKEGGLNFYMLNEAKIALDSPQLIWYIVDPHSELKHETRVLDFLQESLKGSQIPIYFLMNKIDDIGTRLRIEKVDFLESDVIQGLRARNLNYQKSFRISAAENLGIEELLRASWDLMPEGPPHYEDPDQVSDRPMRFFAAEMIRGQLFHLLGDEIPYSCAVQIEDYNEKTKPIRIEAVIYVERDSQKGIVIGQGGKKIKEIGQTARAEIEKLVGEQIFLGLKVKVSKDWSANAADLRQLGYVFGSSK